MAQKRRRSRNVLIDESRTSLAAATTIAARTPVLARAALRPSPHALLESQRMVMEKWRAAGEGWLALSTAWSSLMLRAMLGISRPMHHEMDRLLDAATAPAVKACRANARRFTRRRKRRR